MLFITNVVDDVVTIHNQSTNTDHDVNISDIVRDDSLGLGLKVTNGNIDTTYMVWTGSDKVQLLWQAWFVSELTLNELKDEASNRSLPNSGKTKAQLASDIIEYECGQKATPFLI